MYTRLNFAMELKKRLAKQESLIDIGTWAYEFFLDYDDVNDVFLLKLLLVINKMELGPEFFFSYEKLNEIAEDLIAGHEINLDY